MIAYVLDASVAAKWFLPAAHETLADEAMRVLDAYVAGQLRLLVPDLFWPEFGKRAMCLTQVAPICSMREWETILGT